MSFQTADAYVDFVRIHSRRKSFTLVLEFVFKFFKRIKLFSFLEKLFPQKSIEKKFKLFQLKGFYYSELDQLSLNFYNDVIKKHFVAPIYHEFLTAYQSDQNITIVSGGYNIYLNHFVSEFPKCKLVSTKLKFDHDIFSGRLLERDCLYNEKVVQLEKLNYSSENSIVYTDSFTDLPLLKWCEQGIVVSKSMHQTWSAKYGFKEIIW